MSEGKQTLTTWVLGAAVMVLAFAGGMWIASRSGGVDGVPPGVLWPNPPAVADFHLIDHTERPLRAEELRGRWTLLFFGFTHCPDVCPTALASLAAAEERLRADPAFGDEGRLVFVSVDPERDTVEQLRDYVGYFSPTLVGATASLPELKSLTRSLGALFMKVEQGENQYSVDHSAGIFYVSPDLRLMSVLTPPQSADEIVSRFATVAAFSAERG